MADWPLSILQHAIGPVVAVGVAVCVQIWLVLRGEKRQARCAFAEAIEQCCDVMESVAVQYWTSSDSETRALVGKMNAALIKMARLTSDLSRPSRISDNEVKLLQDHWGVAQKALRRDFDVASRRIDPEKMIILIRIILSIRCEAAKLRA